MESGKWKTHPTENVSTETWRVNRSFKTSKHFALCERLSSIYSNAAASRIWNSFLSRWFIRVLQQSVIYQKKKKFEPLKTTSMWWRQIMILTFRVMLLCSWVQYFFKNGPFRPLFSLFWSFQQLSVYMFIIEFRRWLDSNRGPLVSEATTLPTEWQPRPNTLGKEKLSSNLWYTGFEPYDWVKILAQPIRMQQMSTE